MDWADVAKNAGPFAVLLVVLWLKLDVAEVKGMVKEHLAFHKGVEHGLKEKE